LINIDLQELSKAEAGYLSINLQPFNIFPLLQSLVARFADQLLEDGPALNLNSSSPLPSIIADSDRTEQILVNLIGNAIRHTHKGSITIETITVNQYLSIAVIDTGEGIAPED